MKKIVIGIIVNLSCILMLCAANAAQLKIGIIDVEKIVHATPQMDIMTEKAKKQFVPQDEEVKLRQKKFTDSVNYYAKNSATMNKKNREAFQKKFDVVQKDLYDAKLSYERVMYKANQEAMQTVLKQIHDVAVKVAKEEKISFVLVKGAVFYTEPNALVDISDKVIQKLKNN